MIKAVLCDIDGTLLQSNWLHAAAWKDALAAIGIDVPLEEVRRQIGKGGDQLIPVFVPWWKRLIVGKQLKENRESIFRDKYLVQVEPFPQARELLLHMKQSGIKVSLASSAKQKELEHYKKLAQIEDLVEASTSADDASRSKPHPDIFQATLKQLGVDAQSTLALGDTPYDAEAAGKANVATVGVTTGGWTEKELLAAGCIEVYKDVADLLARFDQSAFAK